MSNIHIILQGKGGVGKSLVASLLTQYLIHKHSDTNKPLTLIDTDPLNKTFSRYKRLPVQSLDILENDQINQRRFDEIIELIAQSKGDTVIDNGASSFIALSTYIKEMEIAEVIKSLGHKLVIHTIITGGQAFNDTLVGFAQIVNHLKGYAQFIIWLNPYWGEIMADGKPFEQLTVYKANKEQITALIQLPVQKQETFGHDLSTMLNQNMTFDEAIADPDKTIMTRQRLKIMKDDIYKRLDAAVIL
ncbi:MAG: conjugal transfer protein TraL [Methylococcales bacterium]|jgi:hypothetical protein|nr:conjugal transfer protein TraL [Methylococcaceae bacterium]